jgi:hypothetical protein
MPSSAINIDREGNAFLGQAQEMIASAEAKGVPAHDLIVAKGIELGFHVKKIGLMRITDVKTGEEHTALVACPPDGMEGEPVIPLAILIDGDPYERFVPTEYANDFASESWNDDLEAA